MEVQKNGFKESLRRSHEVAQASGGYGLYPVRGVKPVLGLMYPPRKPCLPNPDAWWGTRRHATSCFFMYDLL